MRFTIETPSDTLLCEEAKSHVLNCKDFDELDAINLKNYNVASLKRAPDFDISDLLNSLTKLTNFHFQQTSGKERIMLHLKNYLSTLGIHPTKELEYFLGDIENLIGVFNRLTNTKKVNLLLTVVNTNMCKLFHTDINELRLLCTYKGKGTLWVDNSNVNWNELNCCNTNEKLIKDQNKVHQAKAFEVLILKGALHKFNSTHAILHRSPTIEETKQKRLLLRIDKHNFGKL